MPKSAEEQLRSALAAADFHQVQRLLPIYSGEIATWLAQPATRQEHQQALHSFHNLLSLARVMRAHISTQLSKLQRQSHPHYQIPATEKHSWRYEG